MYHKLILDNGVRVVTERIPSTKSVTIGIWVNVGSRDEPIGKEGISHFLEHMFFKGTRRRSAAQISREIDALGGEMNAFTTREHTAFYVKVVDQLLHPALTLLADLFHHSRFDPKEVEKEKQVVQEEIRMVLDDPEDLLHDLHIEHQLQQHPLGKSILGDAATIQRFRRGDLSQYVRDHYAPGQTVVAVAGNFEWKILAPLMKKTFGAFPWKSKGGLPQRCPAEVRKGGLLVRRKELEQAHLCFGLEGIPVEHKDRYAAHALNVVLGGGVSSRLFQQIRERRGLVYSIYSYLSSFSDTGTLTIYAATRPREAPRVVELVSQEIRKLRRGGIGSPELERAKNQMKGGLLLSLESSHSRMNKLAREELNHGRNSSLKEILRDVDRITESQVLRIAGEILEPDHLSVTALGPVSHRSLQAVMG